MLSIELVISFSAFLSPLAALSHHLTSSWTKIVIPPINSPCVIKFPKNVPALLSPEPNTVTPFCIILISLLAPFKALVIKLVPLNPENTPPNIPIILGNKIPISSSEPTTLSIASDTEIKTSNNPFALFESKTLLNIPTQTSFNLFNFPLSESTYCSFSANALPKCIPSFSSC